jgi:hypothetical protein
VTGATLTLAPETAVLLGLWWASIAIEPEQAARLAWGGGLDDASARMVIRAYGTEWNRARLGGGQPH